MKIVFMGTPEFAVASLDILYNAGYNIVGVVTATDKWGGRGRKTLLESAVKKYAVDKGIKVLQPKNLKAQTFIDELKALEADIQIVVAFRMLPVVVWDMPPEGTYNLHGSLLPSYRGAAPINWAVMRGDKKTGVTTFKLKHEIDTGAILFQKEIPIYDFDTAGDVHDRMMWVGAGAVLETVQAIEKKDYTLKEQDDSLLSHAPKLNKENTIIDFDKPVNEVYNHIRGLSPFPTAWFKLEGKSTKIYKATYKVVKTNISPGTVLSDNKNYIYVTTEGGYIDIKELQLSGKRRLKTKDLLNGFTLEHAVEAPSES